MGLQSFLQAAGWVESLELKLGTWGRLRLLIGDFYYTPHDSNPRLVQICMVPPRRCHSSLRNFYPDSGRSIIGLA